MLALDGLKENVARLAGLRTGLVPTALPELWVARFDAPVAAKRVEAKMVTLALILQGSKRVDFGSTSLTYRPGSYLFVTGERKYNATIDDASAERPYLSLSILLSPERIAETVFALSDAGLRFDNEGYSGRSADSRDGEPSREPHALVATLDAPILDALKRLIAALDDGVSRQVLAPLIERELLVHLLRSPSGDVLRRAASYNDGRIQRALAYLSQHMAARITVESVARRVAMSPSHFAHRFQSIVRMSPMQYLKHLRLQRARMLMLGEGLRAAEVAAEVGYSSPSHFTRDFKARFGAPPASYVRQLRR